MSIAFAYEDFGEYAEAFRGNAKKLDAAFAEGAEPPPRVNVAEWAEQHRVFPDDHQYPGAWRNDTAPELVEIMEAMTPSDPCEEVSLIKAGQTGGSAAVENLVGAISDYWPAPSMYVNGTIKASEDWAKEKFWPMVRASKRLDPDRKPPGTIVDLAEEQGSTSDRIKFRRGGYLLLSGANSAASLRQHTIRFAIEDDLDQFPDDCEKQGSPEAMVDTRLKGYRRLGLSKRIKVSTPLIKGASKIERAYLASDRRRYYLVCPGCGERFDPVWDDIKWPDGKPEEAYLVTPCCHSVIEHWQKQGMKTRDGWCPTIAYEGLGKAPRHMTEEEFQARRARGTHSRRKGYHLTGIISSFDTWASMAASFLAAQGDTNALMAWTNLTLGDVFEMSGSVPDFEKLKALREQGWGATQMPYGPVVFTIGADVQGDGIYYERCGFSEHDESWSIEHEFIVGATDVAHEGAWKEFDKVCKRPFVMPGGRKFPADQICVDAGYNTQAVEAFCKGHANRLAVFGRDGWTRPVIGRGENLRYVVQGKRAGQASKRSDDKAYVVGTYGIKATFYGFLRATLKAAKEEIESGREVFARGRCHFGADAKDEYFEHITSEAVVTKTKNGMTRRVWDVLKGRQNHWLDCRVYNYAAAAKLLLGTLDADAWAAIRAERMCAPEPAQSDMFAGIAPAAPTEDRHDPERSTAQPWTDHDLGED